MLDGLLGRGFASKCKSSIKVTRTRIDVLRRKRNATQKFLKKDMADLLANGLDINAFGRGVKQSEGLLAELNLSSCYDFVEHSCECILKHLSIMQKQSECPEECRVAVASLMFAAARLSDLPELRDLRDVFQERYGNSLEYFVNPQFVENSASKPPTMEKKLQFMQGIALEFSIKWDSRAFEQRMSNPSVSTQDKPKKYGSFHGTDDKYKSSNGSDAVPKRDKHDILSRERHELSNDGYGFRNRREANVSKKEELDRQFFGRKEGTGHKPLNGREETILKRDDRDMSFQKRPEVIPDKHESRNGKEDTAPKTVRLGSSSHGRRLECIDGGYQLQNGKQEFSPICEGLPVKSDGKDIPFAGNNHVGQHNVANLTKKVLAEGADRLKSYGNAIPPPYVKPPKASKGGSNLGSKHAGFDCNGASTDPSAHGRANAGNRSEKIQVGSDHPDYEMQGVGAVRGNSHNSEKDPRYKDDVTSDPMPKPRSVRRQSKPASSHDDVGNFEERRIVKRNPSGRRRGDSRGGLQILFEDEHGQKDEEEKRIDKLLMHYSKKPSSYEPGKVRKKSNAHPSHDTAADVSESAQNISRDESDVRSEMDPPPVRSVSLPREQTAPSEPIKLYARAASFQSDRMSPARHVHPKLPDYDDLAARFAALKGR